MTNYYDIKGFMTNLFQENPTPFKEEIQFSLMAPRSGQTAGDSKKEVLKYPVLKLSKLTPSKSNTVASVTGLPELMKQKSKVATPLAPYVEFTFPAVSRRKSSVNSPRPSSIPRPEAPAPLRGRIGSPGTMKRRGYKPRSALLSSVTIATGTRRDEVTLTAVQEDTRPSSHQVMYQLIGARPNTYSVGQAQKDSRNLKWQMSKHDHHITITL